MPGVVTMENGMPNGVATNHDRDANGSINGAGSGPGVSADPFSQKQNGDGAARTTTHDAANGYSSSSQLKDLPDEIQHITEGYIPLGLLLSRLAQKTHNQLQDKVLELAKMPAPNPTLNGNAGRPGGLPDDVSVENLNKKATLLKFIQDAHADWTKALIIASWSRRATTVSKLLDLKGYIEGQSHHYGAAMEYLMNVKRSLAFAQLPNPDLRTALQVLASGEAPWMPDLGYIEPPPLSLSEQMQWVEEINTLLSLRLNLEDHDKIPRQFQDYSIGSGRVTFHVAGEFEVDLTIADEDFEKQFWFIDFRFSFSPAPAELTDFLRLQLEMRVNEALSKDGLQGCYDVLHEYVLTHKITEFVRQARELARGRWVDTLKVERLNRAMSIQYWANRKPTEGSKSWVILGVDSGKKLNAAGSSTSSHLTLRWFRDGKEVKDAAIPLDYAHISTETLLKTVIAQHVGHILSIIHGRLKAKARFARREAALSLSISPKEPVESVLRMQLNYNDFVSLQISPVNGLLSMTPPTDLVYGAENNLNFKTRDPGEEGMAALEYLRCQFVVDKLRRRGSNVGWACTAKSPVKFDDVKAALKTNEQFSPVWLRKRGWPQGWHVFLRLSLGGDRWYLVEVVTNSRGPRIATISQLRLTACLTDFTDKFLASLNVFSAGVVSRIADLKVVHKKRVKYRNVKWSGASGSIPPGLSLPALALKLTDLLNVHHGHHANKISTWALDCVLLMFRGVRAVASSKPALQEASTARDNNSEAPKERFVARIDARIKVADGSKFSLLKPGNMERDVAFSPRLGVFALRLEAEVGTPILETLAHRIQAIGRLVDCVEAIRRSSSDVRCESITLARIEFSYSDAIGQSHGTTAGASIRRWTASLDLRNDRIKMSLEQGNPHLRTLDLLNDLLNSGLGFSKVPQYLAFTLALLKAFDAIEDSWEDLSTNNQGSVEVFARHIDWYNIRYTLSRTRRANIEIKLRERRGELSWHVFRHESRPAGNPDDELKPVLQAVWEAKDKDWTSFVHSAACNADDRIARLLQALNKAMLDHAKKPKPVSPPQPKAPPKATPKPKNQRAPSGGQARPPQNQVVVLDD